MAKDTLLKVLALNDRVRVYIVNSTSVTNEAIKRHDLWPSAASVLGKTMAIGLMMGAMLKGEEALTIKIDGNGPIGTVCVDAYPNGTVRGYVERNHVHFTNKTGLDDVYTLGYNGYIDVIKDLKLKDLFTSTIPLQTGDLAKDFTYYFMKSEQTPSLVALGSLFDIDNTCKVCGGIIIQLLPNALEEDITYIESKMDILSKMSDLMLKNENLEDIIKLIFADNYKVLETKEVSFNCPCSKEHFAEGLLTLPKKDLEDIINNDHKAEVVCHYCEEKYTFTEDELKELLKGAK